jgi:hypothetical protein
VVHSDIVPLKVGCGFTDRWDWVEGWLELSIPTKSRSMPHWSANW